MSATINSALAREHLTDVINDVAYKKQRTIITRNGKKMVAVIPVEDLDTLEMIEDNIDARDAKKALANLDEADFIPLEKVKVLLGL